MRPHGLPRSRQFLLIIEDVLGGEGKILYIFLVMDGIEFI
ncbi:hypothetical protein CWATWH8502_1300 [Crocosphaera watsonii WH 8502]|uniref:Uncharacterized protein n=5 Tax=Crocosphaera watsonii TaxID=263511 RepID=T2JM57_CROWT|nr:hypothetical protein CWATWH0003_3336 [Crocosphaera watsonii WH 0003]CCQ50058.1 hypothetical protein CWATWH8502_1300 [Crocosphaera watsonii WH 8502]CCQ54485.1 hypothetical protein CWATWH0005_3643 [Crocosphaera watsonii WH 0005]CCQ60163.1 hypothetical protein CWATWH0401_1739 [Crocosphaera watsonii WH 0401]CCQ65607.1 hypothetical protein CWATWH0402_4299 [Crocosphaera watsonii WH 0402]